MSNHYSDYLKKSISPKDLVFDKVKDSDKDVLSRVRKAPPGWFRAWRC